MDTVGNLEDLFYLFSSTEHAETSASSELQRCFLQVQLALRSLLSLFRFAWTTSDACIIRTGFSLNPFFSTFKTGFVGNYRGFSRSVRVRKFDCLWMRCCQLISLTVASLWNSLQDVYSERLCISGYWWNKSSSLGDHVSLPFLNAESFLLPAEIWLPTTVHASTKWNKRTDLPLSSLCSFSR